MSDPTNHHHIPQFLLSGWCREDGRLAVYSRPAGKVVISWRTPEYTGFEPNLYMINAVPPADQQWLEREVMSKQVDNPAALVHRRLLCDELQSLSAGERCDWTRFVLAQTMRSPEMIAELRQNGREHVLKALNSKPEEYDAIRGNDDHETLIEWAQENFPDIDEIVSMGRVLPRMIANEELGNVIINMKWEVIRVDESNLDLLISDTPLIRLEGLKSPNCVIYIPISPRHLFITTHRDRGFSRVPPTDLVRAANRETVGTARRRVYGTDGHHLPLVEKRLRPEFNMSI